MVHFDRVRAEFGAVLGRVAAMYAAPGAERDDLQQEIAIALVSALPKFRGDSSLRTYVLRVAHNCGVRHITRRRAAPIPLDEDEHASATPSPEQSTAARQEVELLASAIRELPLGLRQVMVLTLEGLTQREIGEVLGLEDNAVSVRLHRARTALARRLQQLSQGVGHG